MNTTKQIRNQRKSFIGDSLPKWDFSHSTNFMFGQRRKGDCKTNEVSIIVNLLLLSIVALHWFFLSNSAKAYSIALSKKMDMPQAAWRRRIPSMSFDHPRSHLYIGQFSATSKYRRKCQPRPLLTAAHSSSFSIIISPLGSLHWHSS